MLTAVVVSADSKKGDQLRATLQQTGMIESVVQWVPSSDKHPGEKESIPDVILLDIADNSVPFYAFASHLHRLRPNVRIIACSPMQNPDPEVLMQAMRTGVREFLPKPVDPAKLREALSRFTQEKVGRNSKNGKNLFMVMGSKGGVGTSTVTVNLSVQLAQVSKKRVALLDFARPIGHSSLLLDLQPRYSIRDAVENVDRLDAHFFAGLLTPHKSKLEVLAGTSHPEEWGSISMEALSRVVNVAQASSDYVIVDCGSNYTAEWAPLLRLAKNLFLIAEANVPALWNLEKHLSTTAALGFDPNRVHVIINRWNRGDEEALKAVEKTIKRPIFARLRNDFRRVSEAENLGVPLSRNHNNRLLDEYREIAIRLSGNKNGAPVAAKRNGLATLLPFTR